MIRFEQLAKAGLKLKPGKCILAQSEVHYLGHVVSKDGTLPDPKKVEAVKNYPTPADVKKLRQFLGLANYYYQRILQDS